jgi:hypothetical protein
VVSRASAAKVDSKRTSESIRSVSIHSKRHACAHCCLIQAGLEECRQVVGRASAAKADSNKQKAKYE